jgi:hypothetical protein
VSADPPPADGRPVRDLRPFLAGAGGWSLHGTPRTLSVSEEGTVDEDVRPPEATVPPRPRQHGDVERAPAPPPADRARYRPLRGLEELLDDVLGRAG